MYPFGWNWLGLGPIPEPTPEGVRPRNNLGQESSPSKPYVFPRKIGKIREYGQKKGNALPIKEKQMCTIVKNRQKDKDSTK